MIERARSSTYAQGESKEDPACLKAQFKALCETKKNITMLRHRFNTRNQKASETFQSYLVDLRNKADACELGDKKEEFIRDRIVVGISSDTVRKLLLQEAALTLDKAVQICQLHELAESDNKAVNQDPDVNVIKQKKFFRKQTPQYRQRKCKDCDTTHQPRKCPAFGVQCSLCNKYNQFVFHLLLRLSHFPPFCRRIP